MATMAWQATAQNTADTRRDTILLHNVVVTGFKSERATASSSTVLEQATIERDRVVSERDASGMVPNFFIPEYGSRMTSTIYVRGLGARIDQPSMGLCIDNVPVLCKENYDFDVPDISRLEMLRGPQSSLYGRNTMGGQMNITTLSPLDWQGTRTLVEAANHGRWRLGVSQYSKLGDKWGIMAGGYMSRGTGEYVNAFNGKRTDWERLSGGRMKVVWRPTAALTISNLFIYTNSRQGGYPYEWVETGTIAYNDTCFYRRSSIIDGLNVEWRLPRFTLTSVTSFQHIHDNMTLDQDFTPLPYFTLTQARRENALTQEVLARGNGTGDYGWLAGVFGFYRRYHMNAPVTFKDVGIARLIEEHANEAYADYPIRWASREFVLGSDFISPSWGVAIYHQSSYTWKRLTATAALRLDYEHARLNYRSSTHTGYDIIERATGELFRHDNIDIDDSGTLNKHFLQLLPKFTLTYTFSKHSAWLSVAKGYKAGGFNTQMFSDVLQQRLMGMMGIGASYDVDRVVGYKPEKAWNYEVGVKLYLADGRFKAQLDAFYIDCRDRQLTTFPDGTTTGRVMTNAGKTRSVGVEAQITAIPLTRLTLTANYGYCDARFIDYNDGRADYRDKRVPYSPEHTLYLQGLYTVPLNRGPWFSDLTFDVNARGIGDIYWNEANTQRQPFYMLLGAGVTLAGDGYTLQLWGRNLTNTRYNTFYFVSIGHEFLQRGHDRQFGLTLSLHF